MPRLRIIATGATAPNISRSPWYLLVHEAALPGDRVTPMNYSATGNKDDKTR